MFMLLLLLLDAYHKLDYTCSRPECMDLMILASLQLIG